MDKPKRNALGQLLPGQSGNVSGRPKTSKLSTKDKKEFVQIFKDCVKGKQLEDAISWLCERANDTNEIFKLLKEFAPYIVPKLSSTKTEVNEIRQVRISFVAPEEKPIKTIDQEILNITNEE